MLAQRDTARIAADERFHRRRKSLALRLDKAAKKIRRRHKERLREARDTRDNTKREAEKHFTSAHAALEEQFCCRAEICALQKQAIQEVMRACVELIAASGVPFPQEVGEAGLDDENVSARRRFARALERGREHLAALRRYVRLEQNKQRAAALLFLGSGAIGMLGVGIALDWTGWHWILGVGAGGPLLLLTVAYAVWLPAARRRGEQAFREFHYAIYHAQAAVEELYDGARDKFVPRMEALARERNDIVAQAEEQWKMTANTLKVMRNKRLEENREKVNHRREAIARQHQEQLADLEYRYLPQIESLAEEHESRMAELVQWQQEQLAGHPTAE